MSENSHSNSNPKGTAHPAANGNIPLGISSDQKKEIEKLVSKTLDLDLKQALDDHGPENRLKIIKQWHLWRADHKATIRDSGWDFYNAIQKAFYDSDRQTKENSFAAAKSLACFDLMSDLVRVVVQPNYHYKEEAASTLLFLSKVWYRLWVQKASEFEPDVQQVADAVSRQKNGNVKWPANQAHLRKLLEEAASQFTAHQRYEILAAFFLVLDFTDLSLRRNLQNDALPAHETLVTYLSSTKDPTVVEKLAGFISVRNPTAAMVHIWQKRNDQTFIDAFFDQVAHAIPNVVGPNLRRVGKPNWLEDSLADFGHLSVEHQSAILIIAQITMTDQDQLLEFLLQMLTAAHAPVQTQLVTVLCSIPGTKATSVIEYLLETQSSPAILTIVIPQIRKRNIHGAMKKLLAFLDHQSQEVRNAAGESFGDCTIGRYLQAFDMLNEKVRISTGQLVSKVDPNVCRVLLEELTCPHSTTILKALVALRYIGRRDELESAVCDLAKHRDPKIRETAAETLGYYPTDQAKQILRRALADSDLRVQKAAERSLQFLSGF